MAWNEHCGAKRRDGQPCGAPAIPYGFVCLKHGGSAKQVQFAAHRRRLQVRYFDAVFAWEEARGTKLEFERLGQIAVAERKLEAFEAKLAELARLRALLSRKRADARIA